MSKSNQKLTSSGTNGQTAVTLQDTAQQLNNEVSRLAKILEQFTKIDTNSKEDKSPEKSFSTPNNPALHELKYIIKKMPGYIYWKNKKSEYMGCNERLAKFSNLNSPSEVIGKTDYDFEWEKEIAERFIAEDQEVMKTEKILITEDELPKEREDGKKLYIRTEKMPFYDYHGDVVGVLAIAFDITDQKNLEKEIIAEKDKAEQANLTKTEFIRNMEHDIRTPFSGVWGMADYLLGIEEDPTKKELLSDVSKCAKELLDYCNTILDFSKVEADMFQIIERKFNLFKLCDSIQKIEQPAAKHKGLDLQTAYDETIPDVLIGDEQRLKRILLNLVSNAIKFTKSGHIKLSATLVEKKEAAALVRFVVEDSGIGIPADKHDYIFEKFTRLSLSNKGLYKGSGLGLRVVKKFMQELGGEIDLLSELGKGSQFICTIPFKLPLTNAFVNVE